MLTGQCGAFSIAIQLRKRKKISDCLYLRHVGLYLPTSVFSHGQLYVTVSRVASRKGSKILITDKMVKILITDKIVKILM
ncbi:helicase, putative [Medicago truncatula]|uniref:Helicase, putative n=1 Tax=Medicago truncatula TaxID=3880 RepID=G8A2T6_MEDTR|nr:helicase, putative [Medicago truncatula]